MSIRQLKTCAAKLPSPQREKFMVLMSRATTLILQAAELRSEAWALYRATLNVPKRSR